MYLRKCYLLHNMDFMKKDMHWRNRWETIGDRFREHLRDVERNDRFASRPDARHFKLSDHSSQHMTICGLPLHQGNTEAVKT